MDKSNGRSTVAGRRTRTTNKDDGGGDVLKVRLSVQGCGEGHVVEGSLDSVDAGVGLHPLDAILGLVWGQLAAEFLSKDVRLKFRVE